MLQLFESVKPGDGGRDCRGGVAALSLGSGS
jgi:hypothetical protein